MSTVLQLAGVAALVTGVLLLSIPAGLIVGGIGLVLIGMAVSK
jgi:hypothetical protein